MRFLRSLAATLLMVSALQAGAAPSWHGTATRISDGDTVWVRPANGGKPVKIRMAGIDAPEICQASGQASRQALARRVQGRQLAVFVQGRDDYGRTVAALHADGEDVAGWMVGQGHAWSYRSGRSDGPYAPQEARARAAARGLFADRAALEPREFRRRHGACPAVRRRP